MHDWSRRDRHWRASEANERIRKYLSNCMDGVCWNMIPRMIFDQVKLGDSRLASHYHRLEIDEKQLNNCM